MNILKPESYLSPFLLSYLSKYIQDIEQKNLQLSLWGGDAVLNNLKFKLDVLDDELGNIPFSFVSCQAQELRIHVPWNKLTSESIVVTLNTVECVLKLNCAKNLKKKRVQQDDSKPTENTSQQQQQSSYVDMIIKKIKRNVVFVVNNLILKYVEDDIVLSMNVHSFSYKPVDKNWQSAFLDLTESEPALRYLCNVQDLTVCLDRRGKSGNVETFEEPMLFRCNVDIRQHYTFASHLSKKPLINKIHIMFDHYHLNISEKQLPTMLHLLKLCMHLYYKQIEVNHSYVFDDSKVESHVEDSQGWASWAWSYVPPIMSYEEAEAERTPLTIVFGIYIKNLMINFKLSRTNKTKQFYWNESFRSKCLCQVQIEGVTLQLLAKGLEIFSCDFSVSSAKLVCGNSFVGAKFLDMANDSLVIAVAGCSMFKFAENSLFDSRAPENNDEAFVYALNKETFFIFDEQDNSKAFCSKYFYKAVDGRDEEDIEDEKFNDYLGKVCLTDFQEWHQTQERSWKHFKLGGDNCQVFVSSYTVKCFDQLLAWAQGESYKDYPLKPKVKIEAPTNVENNSLSFVPCRSTIVEVNQMKVLVISSHQVDTKSDEVKTFICLSQDSISSATHDNIEAAQLPGIVTFIPRVSFKIIQPMYGEHLSALLSTFLAPPKHLMRSCYTQYDLELPAIKCCVSSCSPLHVHNYCFPTETENLIHVENLSIKLDRLQGVDSWKERLSMVSEQIKCCLESVSVKLTLIGMELMLHVIDSWLLLFKKECKAESVIDTSSLFSLDATNDETLIFNMKFNDIIVDFAKTFSSLLLGGALKSLNAFWTLNDVNYPLIQCSHQVCHHSTLDDFRVENLNRPRKSSKVFPTLSGNSWTEDSHCMALLLQVPHDSTKKGCLFVNIHHIDVCIDISILSVLLSCYHVYPSYIMPSVFQYLQASVSESSLSDNQEALQRLQKSFSHNIMQVEMKGIQVFLLKTESTTSPQYVSSEDYSKSIATHLLQSGENFKLWSISLPMMVALTAGHKKVRISSELIKTGINLNMFNEFETLNVGFETCEAFSVSSDSKSEQLHHEQMIEPFCATCTIACSNLDKGDCKTCVSLHLDVEPIELNISGAHLNLQANFMTSALTLVKDIYHKLKGIDFDGVSNVDPASYSLASNSFGPNDSKSKIEIVDKKPKKKSWPLSIWLQCTVSRVVLNFIDDTSYFYKTSGSLEDISLSLDKQLVFLKLMCSFNSCKLHQFPKSSNGSSTCLDGLSLSPMYTAVPSFIKADGFQTKGSMTPGKPPASDLKPGKFVEIVYARALVEDYHKRKLQKGEEANEGDQELKPEDEIPMKEYLHEITFNMQAFDVVANPTAVQDLAINLFGEALKLIRKESTQATNRPRLTEIPRLYVNIGGCRVFVPVASACSSKMESLENDVLVLSLNKLEINPKPENPLSRLVVSPSVYANAQSKNLLECPGSYVEDIQIECTMQDISVGGANWSAILDSIDKSKPCDNPALHWNTTGETEAGPHFYPIVDQFDLLMVYAPAISYLKSEHEKVVVCAPSLEVNFLKDCYFHLNLMHCSLLAQTYIACQNVITPKGNTTAVGDRSDSPFVFESTCGGSSLGSSRPVKASKARLMGEFFITGKNFMLSFYQTLNRKSNRFKPLLFLNMVQPTFCSHVSKKREKVELQVHDLSFNVLKYQTASDEEGGSASNKSEMIKVFQTKTGMVKTRTGVPASFLLANVTNFLTRKACLNIVVEKPLHFCLNPSLVDHTCLWLKEVCPVLEYVKKACMSSSTSIPAEDNTNLNFSKLKLTSSQLILDVDCPSSSVRSSIQGLSIETCLCESQWSTDLNASGLSVRTTDNNAITSELLFPFSIEANFTVNGISLVSDKIRKLTLKLSPVRLKLSPTVVDTILNCIKITKDWMLQVIDGLPDRTVTSLAKLGSSVYFESPDDLRRGSYEYISVTDPSVLPQAGQICFYDGENHGVMAWCNKQPVKVKRFEIVPLMLQDNALGASASIECSLEIYNEASQKFETVHDFRVEESKAIRFELEQSDEYVSDRWRVVVHSRVLSPKMLAASMKVDCVFDSKDLPSLLVCFDIDQLTIVSSEDTACIDCAKLEVSNVQGSLRLCMESQAFTFVLKPVMSVSMFLINYSHLTWIPTVLPFTVSSSVSSSVNNINATCNLSDVVEVHVSQKILKSIQSLINVWSPMLNKIGPAYNIKNFTGLPLLIGQAMTSECISLEASSNVWYTWRSNKIDPKLHVALKCHLGFSWCEPFAITQDDITLERYFDEKRVVVIDVETNDSLETTITISGCVSFVNDLPFELHLHGKSDQEEFVARLVADKEERADFLFSPDSLQSLSISNSENDDVGGCKLDMAHLFGTNKRSMARVTCDENNADDGKYIQAVSYKKNMRTIIRFLPIFILRSHLPTQCTIHIDTRSEKKRQQICVDGKGCETVLFNLNPDLTHHFSIQIEANDAPFDAAIPMHSSLIYSMEGNQNFTQTKLRFSEHFPYHSISEYLSRSNEKWDQQEGSIKAKLSLTSGSLLMEITPWCLINNRTNMTLCFSSKSGDTTVVQPSQVTVPHHFTSVFAFQTSNSAKSKWYQIDQDVEHPSRVEKKSESLKVWNGSVQHVTLKKQDGVIDVLMKCHIRFGMLVFDISTPWKIRNLSSVHDLKLSASVGPSLGGDQSSEGSTIDGLKDDFVSINEWKVTQGRIVSSGDVSKEQGGDVKMSSNDSTSSFLCLDQINAETYKIFSLNDRLLTISASDLSVTFSVREEFVRKVVNLKAGDDFLQMYVTKESYDEEVFLVISDVTKPNLLFCNHTSFNISLQEQVDFENMIELQLPPDGGEVPYECVSVSENFPYCQRKAFHSNFKLRVDEQTEWSGFSLMMREGKHEVVLGDGLVLWVVLRDINPIKVHLYEKESDCKKVKSPIARSRSFKLMLNEFKLVCLDDVSTALYSLDILQCCFTNVKLELKESAAETWTLHFMVDDIQSDTHICQRYPVFVTSSMDDSIGAGKDSFYFAVMFDNEFKLQAVDVGLKSVEIMCEDGFLKVLAHLFESYSKAIKPKFVGNVDDFTTTLLRNSQAVCLPVQLSFISIKPFNVVVTLNTSYKLDVTLHKGSINFSKLICLNVCGRWSDITEEIARHYFADAVFGAGWVIGSADIIGNPMTTLRNFSKGFSDLLFMPYASIGSGPSAFLSGLTGGVSSLMRNVSYGLLQSMTNVASGLSRNMNSVSGEHEKISFCAEIPGTEVKVYLPHNDPKNSQNAKAPGYMSTIGKTVVKVVTKPLGGAASLVSRMGETIIVSSGMNHVYKPLYKCTSHRLSNYGSSLKKYSQKVHSFFGDDAEHPPCLVSMSCRSNGCPDDESLRVWVLSSDSMFIIRPNDDTIESVLSIEDLCVVLSGEDGSNITVQCNSNQKPCEAAATSSCNDKVAAYLGFDEIDDEYMDDVEVVAENSSPTYCAVAVHPYEARLFASIFHVLKKCKDSYSW